MPPLLCHLFDETTLNFGDPTLLFEDSEFDNRTSVRSPARHRNGTPKRSAMRSPSKLETPAAAARRRRRNISFAEYDQVYDVLHRKDITEDEAKLAWVTAWELQTNLKEFQRLRQELKNADGVLCLSEHEGFCVRGLEMLFPGISKERKLIKAIARDAVFKEQSYQMDQGLSNDEKLAFMYGSAALKAVEVARWRATQDANCIN